MSWAQVDLVHGYVVRRGNTSSVFRVVPQLLGELGASVWGQDHLDGLFNALSGFRAPRCLEICLFEKCPAW